MTTRYSHTGHFYRDPAAWQDADGTQHWVTRGANFVVVASQAKPGAVISRSADQQPDEYFVLSPKNVAVALDTGKESAQTEGDALFIVPPGDSRVSVPQGGWVYRVFSRHAADLAAQADNVGTYASGVGDVAGLVSWPEPVGGYRLRHYALPEHRKAEHPMRLFRTRNLMINVFPASNTPRDIGKMSPHSHADFEQGSLAIGGAFIHHMRHPWGVDIQQWKEDEHVVASAPSLCIIPPKVIHTSQSVGMVDMQLVDIFSPPRVDFSLKTDLVCNADEYPLPGHLQGQESNAAVAG